MTTTPAPMQAEKARAAAWFETLRDMICAEFERLEDEQTTGPHAHLPAGRFERKETRRASDGEADAGGGVMSVMRGGRVFEKVGVNISTASTVSTPTAFHSALRSGSTKERRRPSTTRSGRRRKAGKLRPRSLCPSS